MEKFVLEIPNFIPDDVCTSIIGRFENDNRKVEGSYSYTVDNKLVTREKNNNELSASTCSNWEDINILFIDYIGKAYTEYLNYLKDTFDGYGDPKYPIYERELGTNYLICTGFPIQRLGKGDVYDWHHDGDVSKPYFIQIIFYLNTLQENQGGCTEFIDGKKVRPEMGKVLMYPCSWTFPHKGGEVLDGYKYICTTTISTQNPHYLG